KEFKEALTVEKGLPGNNLRTCSVHCSGPGPVVPAGTTTTSHECEDGLPGRAASPGPQGTQELVEVLADGLLLAQVRDVPLYGLARGPDEFHHLVGPSPGLHFYTPPPLALLHPGHFIDQGRQFPPGGALLPTGLRQPFQGRQPLPDGPQTFRP